MLHNSECLTSVGNTWIPLTLERAKIFECHLKIKQMLERRGYDIEDAVC